eukprot:gene242-4007_t
MSAEQGSGRNINQPAIRRSLSSKINMGPPTAASINSPYQFQGPKKGPVPDLPGTSPRVSPRLATASSDEVAQGRSVDGGQAQVPDYTYMTSRKPLHMARASVNCGLLGDPNIKNRPTIPNSVYSPSATRRVQSASYSAAAWKAYGSPSARGMPSRPPPAPDAMHLKASVVDSMRGTQTMGGMMGGGFVMPRPQSAPRERSGVLASASRQQQQQPQRPSPARPHSPRLGVPPKSLPQPDIELGNMDAPSAWASTSSHPPSGLVGGGSPTRVVENAHPTRISSGSGSGSAHGGPPQRQHSLGPTSASGLHPSELHTLDILAQREYMGQRSQFAPTMPTDPRTQEVWSELQRKQQVRANAQKSVRPVSAREQRVASTRGHSAKSRPASARSERFSSTSINQLQQMGATYTPYRVSGFSEPEIKADRPNPEDPSWAFSTVGQGTLDRLQRQINEKGSLLRPYSAPVHRTSMEIEGGTDGGEGERGGTPASASHRVASAPPRHRTPTLAAVPEEDLSRMSPLHEVDADHGMGGSPCSRKGVPGVGWGAGGPSPQEVGLAQDGVGMGGDHSPAASPGVVAIEAVSCLVVAENSPPGVADKHTSTPTPSAGPAVPSAVPSAGTAVPRVRPMVDGLPDNEDGDDGYLQEDEVDEDSGDEDEVEAAIKRVAGISKNAPLRPTSAQVTSGSSQARTSSSGPVGAAPLLGQLGPPAGPTGAESVGGMEGSVAVKGRVKGGGGGNSLALEASEPTPIAVDECGIDEVAKSEPLQASEPKLASSADLAGSQLLGEVHQAGGSADVSGNQPAHEVHQAAGSAEVAGAPGSSALAGSVVQPSLQGGPPDALDEEVCSLMSQGNAIREASLARDVPAGNGSVGGSPAGDVRAGDIPTRGEQAGDVPARYQQAGDVPARDVRAGDVQTWDVQAGDVPARDVLAEDVHAGDVRAEDVRAGDVSAGGGGSGDVLDGGEQVSKVIDSSKEQPSSLSCLSSMEAQPQDAQHEASGRAEVPEYRAPDAANTGAGDVSVGDEHRGADSSWEQPSSLRGFSSMDTLPQDADLMGSLRPEYQQGSGAHTTSTSAGRANASVVGMAAGSADACAVGMAPAAPGPGHLLAQQDVGAGIEEEDDLGIQADDAADNEEGDSFSAFEEGGIGYSSTLHSSHGASGRPTSTRPASARPTSARPTSARPVSGASSRPTSGNASGRFGEVHGLAAMQVIEEVDDVDVDESGEFGF